LYLKWIEMWYLIPEIKKMSGSLGGIWLLINTHYAFYVPDLCEFSEQLTIKVSQHTTNLHIWTCTLKRPPTSLHAQQYATYSTDSPNVIRK
jgi:hypothetical protein